MLYMTNRIRQLQKAFRRGRGRNAMPNEESVVLLMVKKSYLIR